MGLQFSFKVEFVPIPPDREAAYRKGLRLLLQLFREERDLYKCEVKVKNDDK